MIILAADILGCFSYFRHYAKYFTFILCFSLYCQLLKYVQLLSIQVRKLKVREVDRFIKNHPGGSGGAGILMQVV